MGNPIQGRSGYGIMGQYRTTVSVYQMATAATDHEQASSSGHSLLQLAAKIGSSAPGRPTHGTVAHTHGPREAETSIPDSFAFVLLRGHSSLPALPSHIEVSSESHDAVAQELEKFGIFADVILLQHKSVAMCMPRGWTSDFQSLHIVYDGKRHYKIPHKMSFFTPSRRLLCLTSSTCVNFICLALRRPSF